MELLSQTGHRKQIFCSQKNIELLRTRGSSTKFVSYSMDRLFTLAIVLRRLIFLIRGGRVLIGVLRHCLRALLDRLLSRCRKRRPFYLQTPPPPIADARRIKAPTKEGVEAKGVYFVRSSLGLGRQEAGSAQTILVMSGDLLPLVPFTSAGQ